MILLLCVFLYGLLFFLGETLSKLVGENYSFTAVIIMAFAIFLAIYSRKSKYRGLSFTFKIKLTYLDALFLLPLICFPLANVLTLKVSFDVHYAVLTVGVCLIEEIFFRGFLLRLLQKRWGGLGIIIQAVVFASMHFVNFFNNSDVAFVLMQVASAFAVGLSFGGLAVKYRSLTPVILAHTLVNLTGNGAVDVTKRIYYIAMAVCCIVNILLGVFLLLKRKDKVVES